MIEAQAPAVTRTANAGIFTHASWFPPFLQTTGYGNVMRALALDVPPVYVPPSVSELAAPETPTVPGALTVACAEAPAPVPPILRGSGAVKSDPTLTLVITTLAAAVPPVLAIVS
jgi:hypothetical protein